MLNFNFEILDDLCFRKYDKRMLWSIDTIAIHRIWFDDWPLAYLDSKSPRDIADRFATDPGMVKYTGGKQPYTFLVDRIGVWWQVAPINVVTMHASVWNRRALGVGVVGDFRRHELPQDQDVGLCRGVARLQAAFGLQSDRIIAHDQLEGGSGDPDKECPGENLLIEDVRHMSDWINKNNATKELMRSGVRFDLNQ